MSFTHASEVDITVALVIGYETQVHMHMRVLCNDA